MSLQNELTRINDILVQHHVEPITSGDIKDSSYNELGRFIFELNSGKKFMVVPAGLLEMSENVKIEDGQVKATGDVNVFVDTQTMGGKQPENKKIAAVSVSKIKTK